MYISCPCQCEWAPWIRVGAGPGASRNFASLKINSRVGVRYRAKNTLKIMFLTIKTLTKKIFDMGGHKQLFVLVDSPVRPLAPLTPPLTGLSTKKRTHFCGFLKLNIFWEVRGTPCPLSPFIYASVGSKSNSKISSARSTLKYQKYCTKLQF